MPAQTTGSLSFRSLDYTNFRGGLLFKQSECPYRVADAQIARWEGDSAALIVFDDFLRRYYGQPGFRSARLSSGEELFAERLGRTSAELFSRGILHGRLESSVQNITLAGEIADLDFLVCLRWFEACQDIPFPSSTGLNAQGEIARSLELVPSQIRGEILAEISMDAERVAGISHSESDPEKLASALLMQCFDIYLHSVALGQCFEEAHTDVDHDRFRRNLRRAFTYGFAVRLREIDGVNLFSWCLRCGEVSFKRQCLGRKEASAGINQIDERAHNGGVARSLPVVSPFHMAEDPVSFVGALADAVGYT